MIIYSNTQKSKISKKKLEKKKELLKIQRKAKNELKNSFKPLSQSYDNYRLEENSIKSSGAKVGSALKKEPNYYSGESMIGIGTMHKSNAIPIFKEEDAKDLASMRR